MTGIPGTSQSLEPANIANADLIPPLIGVAAVKRYAQEFLDPAEATKFRGLNTKDVTFEGCSGTHGALERAAAAKLESFHLDKVGFARSVLEAAHDDEALTTGAGTRAANFRVLFHELGRRQRQATRELLTEKTTAKIKGLYCNGLSLFDAFLTRSMPWRTRGVANQRATRDQKVDQWLRDGLGLVSTE